MTDDYLIKRLADWGCDTDDALLRLLGEKDVYIQLVREYIACIPLPELQSAMDKGDTKKVFFISHSMKGVLSNLGLTPLYKPAHEIAEIFRAGKKGDARNELERLKLAKSELQRLLDKE